MRRARIAGIGFHVPEKILTNADLAKMVDTNDEWIRTRTGISERRIAEKGEGVSGLAAQASLKALAAAGIKPESVDLIVCATTTPDQPLPSTACYVQQKIGAVNAAAFDLAAACSGFVYGLVTGEQFIKSGTYKTVLVIGADVISSFVDWTDRSTCVLFGDGAAAAVLTETATGGILAGVLGSDGRHAELLTICGGGSKAPASAATVADKQHYLKMNGAEVFKLAVRGMSDSVLLALEKAGVKKDEIACFVPHQANLRIIDAVSERLEVPKEKVFVNLHKYGNTSAASCAIALCEAVEQKKIKKGDKVVLATFGSGLVWASMVFEW